MKYVIGVVIGLLVGALFVYFFICEKPTPPTVLTAGDETSAFEPVVWKPDMGEWPDDGKRQVRALIKQMEMKLVSASKRGSLEKSDTEAIEKAFGQNGTFVGHDGVTYHGGKRIGKYFNGIVSKSGHSLENIKFKLEVVYAEQLNWTKAGIESQDPVHAMYFVISCRFRMNGEDYDPPGSTHCIHIRSCDCAI